MRGTKPYTGRELPHQGRFYVAVTRDARRALLSLARRAGESMGAVASALILDELARVRRSRRPR